MPPTAAAGLRRRPPPGRRRPPDLDATALLMRETGPAASATRGPDHAEPVMQPGRLSATLGKTRLWSRSLAGRSHGPFAEGPPAWRLRAAGPLLVSPLPSNLAVDHDKRLALLAGATRASELRRRGVSSSSPIDTRGAVIWVDGTSLMLTPGPAVVMRVAARELELLRLTLRPTGMNCPTPSA